MLQAVTACHRYAKQKPDGEQKYNLSASDGEQLRAGTELILAAGSALFCG